LAFFVSAAQWILYDRRESRIPLRQLVPTAEDFLLVSRSAWRLVLDLPGRLGAAHRSSS
jgi:hypothetical protein